MGHEAADRTTATADGALERGAIAQLVERVLCKHEVVGSIPSGSTTSARDRGKRNSRQGPPGSRRV